MAPRAAARARVPSSSAAAASGAGSGADRPDRLRRGLPSGFRAFGPSIKVGAALALLAAGIGPPAPSSRGQAPGKPADTAVGNDPPAARIRYTAVASGRASPFSYEGLAMLPSEGSLLADELAAHVSARLGARVIAGDAGAVDQARRMVALAFALDPRNRRVVVVDHQLARGLPPRQRDPAYATDVFVQLLVERARRLEKATAGEAGPSGGAGMNIALSGLFLALAVELDPRNEDAVYAWEIHRLDHGEPDWRLVTGGK